MSRTKVAAGTGQGGRESRHLILGLSHIQGEMSGR